MTKNERKDQGLWFVSESQKIQLYVGHTGRQVGCFVFHPLFGHSGTIASSGSKAAKDMCTTPSSITLTASHIMLHYKVQST